MMKTPDYPVSRRHIAAFVVAGLLACGVLRTACAGGASLPVAGWVEQATLLPQAVPVKAKLDTGAKTTSIHAPDLVFTERDGRQWVRFELDNRKGDAVVIEREVERTARIRRHFGKKQERPVIMLEICIGPVRKTVEVNLVDRSGLDYLLLIGRNYLGGDLLIHSGRTDLLSASCTAS